MRKYELSTLEGFPYQCWLPTRQEQVRFAKLTRKWKQENPKPTLEREMIAEDLIRCHILSQRLVNRSIFWNGEKSDYQQVADREVDVSTDDLDRQTREFDKYMPLVMRWKLDLLKLSLANNISVNLDGDITSLFSAMDKRRMDGGSNGNQEIRARTNHSELR